MLVYLNGLDRVISWHFAWCLLYSRSTVRARLGSLAGSGGYLLMLSLVVLHDAAPVSSVHDGFRLEFINLLWPSRTL